MPNRRTQELEALALKLDCNPVEILLRFAKGDWKGLGYKTNLIVKFDASGNQYFEEIITPQDRLRAASEAAQYLYAKKKHVENELSEEENMMLQLFRDKMRAYAETKRISIQTDSAQPNDGVDSKGSAEQNKG